MSHADLAEGAAAVLCDEGRFEGPTPPLTGPEALDFEGLARLASKVAGKELRRVTVSDDAFAARLAKYGLPPHVVKISLGMFVAARRGEFAPVDPTLQQLIGRRPATVGDLLAR
ncbi:MAG: hypothetical protein IPJ65_15585 [Archangiaceae bacterium]|nr:hypothetical protein [Archangiaceae bacterium]